jgi:predicted regulator of Ras-like GTPase activity (Roadblock/LC7/MglB family)
MADLQFLSKLPEVRSAVLSDPSGGLVEAIRETDGESVAAVMSFLVSTLSQAGDELGLGPLNRLSVAGPTQASLVVVLADGILSAVIQPPGAFPTVERALDAAL